MRSIDPMRNFPELDGLPDPEAKALINDTQKRITKQPVILVGLIATLGVAALLLLSVVPLDGIVGAVLAGALIGAAAFGYILLIVKPRMHAAFREMGYPRAR